ncbi:MULTISPECIES: YjcZ family sporulation protein [unclassified Paenibacillus]
MSAVGGAFSNAGAILVLFILLVIITCSFGWGNKGCC